MPGRADQPALRIQHLTLEEIFAIHEALLARFGGTAGVRDVGLLESALYRPRSGYYKDVAEMATALFESLLLNHPFVDGNKRVGFFATDVFLRLNGWFLEVEGPAAHAFLMQLFDAGQADFEHLLPWVRRSSQEITG